MGAQKSRAEVETIFNGANAIVNSMMSYADMPAMPEGDAGRADGPPPTGDGIMHACLALPGGAMLRAVGVAGRPLRTLVGALSARAARFAFASQ